MSSCAKCGVEFDKCIIVPCVICRDLYHATMACAGLTASEIKVVELKKKPLMVYRCQVCSKDGGISPDIGDTLKVVQKDIAQIKATCASFDELAKSVMAINSEVQSIKRETSSIPNMKAKITVLESQVNDIQSTSFLKKVEKDLQKKLDQSFNGSVDSIAGEIMDRQRRAGNLILFKVPEEVSGRGHVSDLQFVSTILQVIKNVDTTNLSVRRIGNINLNLTNQGNPRPILVKLHSPEEVFRVLGNRHLLPKNIGVTTDRTPDQRSHLKDLIEEVTLYNLNHQDKKKIHHVNGIPIIVDDNASSKESQRYRSKND